MLSASAHDHAADDRAAYDNAHGTLLLLDVRKPYIVSDDNAPLIVWLQAYDYLLWQPNGHLWLVGLTASPREFAANYRRLCELGQT